MFKNILIVGCGLIGSSILRGSINKKISKNIYVFEKSKKNTSFVKKIDKKIKFLNRIDHKVSDMDLIVLSTHMSQYNNIVKKLQRYISSKSLITDTASTKRNIENLIKRNKKLKKIFIPSHPIAGSEVSGPEFGNKDLFMASLHPTTYLVPLDALTMNLSEVICFNTSAINCPDCCNA